MLTFLTDESEQMKQLSKNNINELWSLSIIQSHRHANLKVCNNTHCLRAGLPALIVSLDMPNNSYKYAQ